MVVTGFIIGIGVPFFGFCCSLAVTSAYGHQMTLKMLTAHKCVRHFLTFGLGLNVGAILMAMLM